MKTRFLYMFGNEMCLLNKFSFYLRQDAMLQSLYFQYDDWFQITLKNCSVLCVIFIVMLLSYSHFEFQPSFHRTFKYIFFLFFIPVISGMLLLLNFILANQGCNSHKNVLKQFLTHDNIFLSDF